ncbi:HAD family hydrolase [Cellulomonas marina]|uniref:Uncharacterized protein n=1 Tax=Cellulomonas marina TaxID=988821 RepID=A0A1I0WSJ6_9CELL|nr:HAD hydrolase family protein [Cellulomonas marina]GIG30316.1 hydrolase [Cellulomonas marina]SFA91752.1 hypothetical protein SAMN05421867_103209 [Cellulomonas marina]
MTPSPAVPGTALPDEAVPAAALPDEGAAPAIPLTTPVRLVVTDMDGSLLDPAKRLPAATAAVVAALAERGIAFCPASGRQLANLRVLLGSTGDGLPFIAENGSLVVRGDTVLGTQPLPDGSGAAVVDAVRALAAAGRDVGVVVCGARSAWVEGGSAAFLGSVHAHYALVEHVDDVLAVDDVVLKLAVFDAGDVEDGTSAAVADVAGGLRVLVSGQHWVDLMHPDADKEVGLRHVQDALGVTAAQTMAFGDYLNDLRMLRAVGYGVAMDNAHPDVRAAARFIAPGNHVNGVLRTLAATFDLDVPGL